MCASTPHEAPQDDARSAAVAAIEAIPPSRQRSVQRRAREAKVLKYEDVPLFLQKNEFIRGHYRGSNLTLREVFMSLFRVHNESGNIYSHLLGCLLFMFLSIWLANSPPTPLTHGAHNLWDSAKEGAASVGSSIRYRLHAADAAIDLLLPGRTAALQAHLAAIKGRLLPLHEPLAGSLHWPAPRWPMFLYFGGAMVCLAMSACCHLFYCCTPHLNAWIWRLDYVGITGLIVTSFYPQLYYAFMCSPLWLYTYLGITTTMGVAAVVVSLLPMFQVPSYRKVRAAVFAGLGLFGLVPMTHMWLSYSHVHALRQALLLDMCMGATYLIGATVYAMRIPERWWPGAFDIFFPSHQIFHICVVVAAYVHNLSVHQLMDWRDASGGCAAPVLGALIR